MANSEPLRKIALKDSPELEGARQVKVKRKIIPVTVNLNHRGAYRTFDVNISNYKVVGVMTMSRIFTDQPMPIYRRFFGVGAAGQTSEAFIESLANQIIQSTYATINVNAGAGQKIYYAQPVAVGKANIRYNGIMGGFKAPVTVSITDNVTGAVEDHYLYESVNENLGETELEIS